MGETICFEFVVKVGGRAARHVFPSNVAVDAMKICSMRLFTFSFVGVHDSKREQRGQRPGQICFGCCGRVSRIGGIACSV